MAEYSVVNEPGALTIRTGTLIRVVLYAFVVLGGLALLLSVLVLFLRGPVIGLLLTTGIGVGFAGSASGILFGRDMVASIRVDARGLLVVSQRGGGSVVVPAAAIAAIDCTEGGRIETSGGGTTSQVSYRVVARKRDGGLIELYRAGQSERAAEVASQIRALLAGEPTDAEAPPPQFSPAVTVQESPDGPIFSWRAGLPVDSAVFAWSIVVGMLLASLAFAISDPGMLFAMPVFVALLGTGLGYKTWRDRGVRQSIAVVGDQLRIERRRGDAVVESKDVPLATVQSVDYTMVLDRSTPLLAVRVGAGRVAAAILEVAAQTEDLGRIAQGMAGVARNTIWVPIERLTLSDRFALDLALSRTVAERKGRAAADV